MISILSSNWGFGTSELITLLGTIATFLAVVVALWQTYSSRKKKLKLNLDFVYILQPITNTKKDYVCLKIANKGYCPVKLSSWYIFVGDIKYCVNNPPLSGVENTTLPLFLNPSEDASLFVEKDKFVAEIILNNKETILKKKKIKTGCYLSTGELITKSISACKLFNQKNIADIFDDLEKKK